MMNDGRNSGRDAAALLFLPIVHTYNEANDGSALVASSVSLLYVSCRGSADSTWRNLTTETIETGAEIISLDADARHLATHTEEDMIESLTARSAILLTQTHQLTVRTRDTDSLLKRGKL